MAKVEILWSGPRHRDFYDPCLAVSLVLQNGGLYQSLIEHVYSFLDESDCRFGVPFEQYYECEAMKRLVEQEMSKLSVPQISITSLALIRLHEGCFNHLIRLFAKSEAIARKRKRVTVHPMDWRRATGSVSINMEYEEHCTPQTCPFQMHMGKNNKNDHKENKQNNERGTKKKKESIKRGKGKKKRKHKKSSITQELQQLAKMSLPRTPRFCALQKPKSNNSKIQAYKLRDPFHLSRLRKIGQSFLAEYCSHK